ncbi:MAG: hypothetical protein KDK39_14905 [Leptospiraceae bacterium]|nr:hypothetical protein [Leptospiraceae bacterium]
MHQPHFGERRPAWPAIVVWLLAGVAILGACYEKNGSQTDSTSLQARFDANKQAFAFIIPNQKPVSGAGLRASDCGVCHTRIYNDWRQSTHAHAMRDIQFQSELTKSDTPVWLCLNCHVPVQNQREHMVTGLYGNDVLRPQLLANPQYDQQMQSEGVTCATCHIRTDRNGNSFIYGPNGSRTAPHPVRQNRAFLHNMCERCHNPGGEAISPNLSCWFHTLDELKASPHFSGQNQSDCVRCHMPETPAVLADNFKHLPRRQLNQHIWVGGGIPKRFEGYSTLLQRGWSAGAEINVIDQGALQPEKRFRVTYKNTAAGHDWPTADPERHILTIARTLDPQNQEIQRQEYRIGQTWKWSPARKIGDNRVKSGELRSWSVPFTRADLSTAAVLEIHVIHLRLTAANMQFLMAAAPRINEDWLPNGKQLVRNAWRYYPAATWIYQSSINLRNGQKQIADRRRLIQMSAAEMAIKPADRIYWQQAENHSASQ